MYRTDKCTVFEDESGYGKFAQWRDQTPRGVMTGVSNNSGLLSFSPMNICDSARHRFCMQYKLIDPEGADICDKNYEMFVRMTEEASMPGPEMYFEDEDPYYEEEEEPMSMGLNINSLFMPIALGGALLLIGYLAFS